MEKVNESTNLIRLIELKRLISEGLEIDLKQIKIDDRFGEDLGLRNISLLGIVHRVEIKFKTGRFTEEEIRKIISIKDLLKLINGKKLWKQRKHRQ